MYWKAVKLVFKRFQKFLIFALEHQFNYKKSVFPHFIREWPVLKRLNKIDYSYIFIILHFYFKVTMAFNIAKSRAEYNDFQSIILVCMRVNYYHENSKTP